MSAAQYELDIGIEIQRDVNGLEMGVLENGIPYLTQSGLSKAAGAPRSAIFEIGQEWVNEKDNPVLGKDRISFVKQRLFENGYFEDKLYIETSKDGVVHYAYPDVVCMAIIEYYAFEATQKDNSVAVSTYRKIANYGLQKFIYDALNYSPIDPWKYHNDRVSLLNNSEPDGYFSIFHQVSGLIVDLINKNLPVTDKTIPDISIGLCWAGYWKDNNLDEKYGERIPYSHNYPSYYPQARSNPQKANAYPLAALSEFKAWFRDQYLKTKFPSYLLSKANVLGGQLEARKIASAFAPQAIAQNKSAKK